MKIVLFYDSMKVNGIVRTLLTLSEELSLKADVELALLRCGGEFLSMLPDAVNVKVLDCTSQPLALISPFSKLARYFREARPDVVLSFNRYNNCLAACAKLLYRFPFRLIVSERNSFGTQIMEDSKFRQWSRIARSRLLYRQAELCICVSHGAADELVDLGVIGREKIRVIYNPVTPKMAEQIKEPIAHSWLENQSPPVIMSVSRLDYQKRLDILIRAFARLRHDMQINARLMIIGDGQKRRSLESLVQELGIERDVCFTGYILNPYPYMTRAAIVALTSREEGFPNVLAEALACGANVISTDCKSGPSEILDGGKYGRLVPVGDAEAFAAAMRDTLAAPLPSETLKSRAAYFSVERSVNDYYDAILGSLNHQKGANAS
ncbi:MAG: glycosyltransferase [Synergistaceae bacterium]|nr:glycosyltransferase [Synergistaceae bacterium]